MRCQVRISVLVTLIIAWLPFGGWREWLDQQAKRKSENEATGGHKNIPAQ
jgi:hypothetical protein